MAEGGNGNNAVKVPVECVDFTVTIHHNVITGVFEVEGWRQNTLVARAMLTYADEMIRREQMRQEIAAQAQNMPRIVPPGLRGV